MARLWVPAFSLLLTTLILLAGCGKAYTPMPLSQLDVVARAKTESQDDITVSAAVLSADEAEHVFGVDLAKIGVQPVWLNIRNGTDQPRFFLPMSLDQDYFSPQEVWFKTKYLNDPETNQRMDTLFREQLISTQLPPHSEMSGFVFTNLHSGSVRMVNVDVVGAKETTSFTFFLSIPGFQADHHLVGIESLYRPEEIAECATLEELRIQLAKLPSCVTNAAGDKEGDPLNLVIVTEPWAIWKAMVRRGWDETEPITGASAMKTVNAFMAHEEYKTSPISPLYVFGRGQDIGLQKARKTIHERNHIRLWLTPITFQGNRVWVGAISRDIGVKMTTKTWNLTTHEIDGDVDEARGYLIQDLAYSQSLKAFGLVPGVGKVDRESPRPNLTDSLWYTDGNRAVMFITHDDTPLADITIKGLQQP